MGRKKRCYSGIGGQAVLEGIMMKNNTRYSVAVRKPNGEIDVEIGEYTGIMGDSRMAKMPFIRGIFSFVDSLRLGTRCLNHSASFYEEEEVPETAADKMFQKVFKDKAESVLMTLTTVLAVVFAVGIFMVLPYFISNYLKGFVRNDSLLAIIEGVIRILIFVLYVLLISLMKDIRRVYMYHGAEHKCINCIERGRELTVENVMKSSKQHRRCGTSFLLFVMLVSVVLFFFIRVDNMALKILIRILLIPVIAGIAYEIIRLAGRSDNWLVRMISAPGLWLQGLTTKEPDESMVEVAIKAVEAVFDWKAYLRENFGYEADDAGENVTGETGRDEMDGEYPEESEDENREVFTAAAEAFAEEAEISGQAAEEPLDMSRETGRTELLEEPADINGGPGEARRTKSSEEPAVRAEEAENRNGRAEGRKAAKNAAQEKEAAAKSRKTPQKEGRRRVRFEEKQRKPQQSVRTDFEIEDEDEPTFIGKDGF